jgi:hypothetical protein
MPETLNGDETQVNLANTASVDIAAAGEYRRRLNSLVVPFQRVAHWLEALREKVNLIAPLTTRVDDLEALPGNTGKRFTILKKDISNAFLTGFDHELIDTDYGIPGVNTTITIGKTGSGASHIWTALDALPTNASAVKIRVFAAWAGANAGQQTMFIFPTSLDITTLSLEQALTYGVFHYRYNFTVDWNTQNVVDVEIDTGKTFKLRWNSIGANFNAYQEKIYYGLYLDGYYS